MGMDAVIELNWIEFISLVIIGWDASATWSAIIFYFCRRSESSQSRGRISCKQKFSVVDLWIRHRHTHRNHNDGRQLQGTELSLRGARHVCNTNHIYRTHTTQTATMMVADNSRELNCLSEGRDMSVIPTTYIGHTPHTPLPRWWRTTLGNWTVSQRARHVCNTNHIYRTHTTQTATMMMADNSRELNCLSEGLDMSVIPTTNIGHTPHRPLPRWWRTTPGNWTVSQRGATCL